MTTEYAESFRRHAPGSGASLTPDRMLELCMRHELFEFDNDLDGILSTLVADPVFEIYPLGVRLHGREAVRLFYESTLGIFRQLDPRAKEVQTREIVSIAFGERTLAAELADQLEFPDGTVRRIQSVAVVQFEGELMVGERIYFDAAVGALIEASLGEEFLARPDVVKVAGAPVEDGP